MSETESGGLSDRAALFASTVFGIVVASGSVWLVGEQGVWFEALNRVHPTLGGGGVGSSWEYGVEVAVLRWAIDLIHLADVAMGIFILVMMFIHWAAFHRLAARMRPAAESEAAAGEAAVTDGGEER